MADRSQRTEQPTARRLEKARKEGKFAVSRELTGALQFLTFALLLAGFGAAWYGGFRESMRRLLAAAFHADLSAAAVAGLAREIFARDLLPLAPAGAVLTLVTLGAHFAMTRFGISLKPLAPNFARLNVLNRLRELPRQNIPLLLQAIVLLPLFAFAVWTLVAGNLDSIRMLPLQSPEQGARKLASSVQDLVWKATGVFVALGAIDYFRQHRRWMADLRMSKQEIRQEMKELEVNPHVKGRIRRLQREYARRRMIQEVPKASAVVVNPTHYAVAIRYALESATAPTVVAKGRNLLAQRIKETAVAHNVPIFENAPLAQALYKSAEVGQEIPAHLYRAVAEILAYIYKLMGGRLPG